MDFRNPRLLLVKYAMLFELPPFSILDYRNLRLQKICQGHPIARNDATRRDAKSNLSQVLAWRTDKHFKTLTLHAGHTGPPGPPGPPAEEDWKSTFCLANRDQMNLFQTSASNFSRIFRLKNYFQIRFWAFRRQGRKEDWLEWGSWGWKGYCSLLHGIGYSRLLIFAERGLQYPYRTDQSPGEGYSIPTEI